jgi:hypothetical protein
MVLVVKDNTFDQHLKANGNKWNREALPILATHIHMTNMEKNEDIKLIFRFLPRSSNSLEK